MQRALARRPLAVVPRPAESLLRSRIHATSYRYNSSKAANTSRSTQPQHEPTWLARQLMASPRAARAFVRIFSAFGVNSPKHLAGRRAGVLYRELCAPRAEEEMAFWRDECHLPPTFQSWFTITNLHVWILTTRLRALPSPVSEYYVQALIDHFFLDVEDRIRAVLAPAIVPSSSSSSSSSSASPPTSTSTSPVPVYPLPGTARADASFYPLRRRGDPTRRGHPPESFVTRQMKVFREQFQGLTYALDLALAHDSDTMLAAAAWRNLLGARGAHGVPYPSSPDGEADGGGGGGGGASSVAQRPSADDLSGVAEFAAADVDRYVRFPETMAHVVEYVRSEVARLARVPDEHVAVRVGQEVRFLDELLAGRRRISS